MFRLFFFILFISISIYGIYWLFSGGVNFFTPATVSAQYETLLSEALERNTPNKESYEVAFISQDIMSSSGSSLENINSNWNTAENNLWQSSEKWNSSQYSTQEIMSLWEEIASAWESGGNVSENEVIWNFWTPNTQDGVFGINENCKGLIYDPCLVLKEFPVTPNNLSLWNTPIYENPSQVSAVYGN